MKKKSTKKRAGTPKRKTRMARPKRSATGPAPKPKRQKPEIGKAFKPKQKPKKTARARAARQR